MVSTETGYHNYAGKTDGHLGLPESTAGRYLPRLALEHLREGYVRAYTYELLDEWYDPNNDQTNFGLIRHDNTTKPGFEAIKSVIGLLSDRDASFSPGGLDIGLSGITANVRHLLLQKSDGRFYVAIWIGRSSWNPDGRYEEGVADQSVTLSIPGASQGRVHSLTASGSLLSSAATFTS